MLSCDKYREVAEHMIFRYQQLWPDHPFKFRIPYQHLAGTDDERHEFVRTPVAIKTTVLTLLQDLNDEEWIYWALDDKYPDAMKLDEVKEVAELVARGATENASAILFCRCREVARKEFMTGENFHDARGRVYLRRRDYNQIWIHQFLKVKVIRYMFQNFPDQIPFATMMDAMKAELQLPADHALYVTEKSYATFGESTVKGKLTRNCYKSIVGNGMSLPAHIPVDMSLNVMMSDTLVNRIRRAFRGW